MKGKKEIKYGLRNGSKLFHGIAAQDAGEELERIRRESGDLRPAKVVKAARKKSSVLHPAFTWDNEKAGEAHRLWEARQLIRVMVIVSDDPGEEPQQAFIHVHLEDSDGEKTENHYQSVAVITTKPDEMVAALKESRNDLSQAERSFRDLARLARKCRQGRERIEKIEKVGGLLERAERQAAQL